MATAAVIEYGGDRPLPPASHFASILIGLIRGSSLYGIFFLTAASFVASYLALAELMRQESPLKTCLAYATFAAVSLVWPARQVY
jgi:hypothetical protein